MEISSMATIFPVSFFHVCGGEMRRRGTGNPGIPFLHGPTDSVPLSPLPVSVSLTGAVEWLVGTPR